MRSSLRPAMYTCCWCLFMPNDEGEVTDLGTFPHKKLDRSVTDARTTAVEKRHE